MVAPLLPSPASVLLERISSELGISLGRDEARARPSHPVPLPSRLATGDLAWASVRAASLVSGVGGPLDPNRVAMAYRSDRVLTLDGIAPDVWSTYSGFWRSADGWIRTHGNYPHHARRLLTALDLPEGAGADRVRTAVLDHPSSVVSALITDAGGLAVPVQREDPRYDTALRATPLLDVRRHAVGDGRGSRLPVRGGRGSLTGIRVLDLTRVIAGPVCTRTLALLGADVLRVDPPGLAEPEWQHLDTGHGKASAILDARDPRFRELLAAAHVVVLGYRPSSLDRLGLSAAALTAEHPGLIVAQLSAWGMDDPGRAGFDSLVQAESGISLIESRDGERPGALPAQALDHSAGYLLAAAVIALLRRREQEGGSWTVRTSLRRVAAELLGMPRTVEPASEREVDAADHSVSFDVAGRTLTTVAPALPDLEFRAPHPWGWDQPDW